MLQSEWRENTGILPLRTNSIHNPKLPVWMDMLLKQHVRDNGPSDIQFSAPSRHVYAWDMHKSGLEQCGLLGLLPCTL
jgi:hypothetical protein